MMALAHLTNTAVMAVIMHILMIIGILVVVLHQHGDRARSDTFYSTHRRHTLLSNPERAIWMSRISFLRVNKVALFGVISQSNV